MALVEAARDVGLDGNAEPAERERHDGQPGQPIRIEIAEDEHPFGPVARRPEALQDPVRVGQQPRIVEAAEGLREPRRHVRVRRRARGTRAAPRGGS